LRFKHNMSQAHEHFPFKPMLWNYLVGVDILNNGHNRETFQRGLVSNAVPLTPVAPSICSIFDVPWVHFFKLSVIHLSLKKMPTASPQDTTVLANF